ncbi:hypothetical protein BZA77DRAFT_356836 [Pyronema omphalodes]|nr:hypothetical protein BZA77DRAFT_356836 [Pyronema omphalodes]
MSCRDQETAIPLHKSSSKSPSTSPPTTTKNAPTNSCNPAPCKTKDYAATIPEGKNLAEWLEISKILDSWIEIMGGEWPGDEGNYDEDKDYGKAEDDDEKDNHRKKNKTIGKSREMKNGERDEEVADDKEEIEDKGKGRSDRDEDRDERGYGNLRRYPKTRSRRAGDNRRTGDVSSIKDDRTEQHRNCQTSRRKSIRQLAEYTKNETGKRESRSRGISSGGNFKLESDVRSSESYRSPTNIESCQRRAKTNFDLEAMPFSESGSHGDEEKFRHKYSADYHAYSAKDYRPLKDLEKSQNYASQTRTQYLPRNITPEKTDLINKYIEVHRPPEQYRRKKHEISLERVPARGSSIEPRTPRSPEPEST